MYLTIYFSRNLFLYYYFYFSDTEFNVLLDWYDTMLLDCSFAFVSRVVPFTDCVLVAVAVCLCVCVCVCMSLCVCVMWQAATGTNHAHMQVVSEWMSSNRSQNTPVKWLILGNHRWLSFACACEKFSVGLGWKQNTLDQISSNNTRIWIITNHSKRYCFIC